MLGATEDHPVNNHLKDSDSIIKCEMQYNNGFPLLPLLDWNLVSSQLSWKCSLKSLHHYYTKSLSV